VQYRLILRPLNPPGYGFASNAFTIAFTIAFTYSPSSSSGGANGGHEGSSGDSTTVAVVASVLSVMAVIGLLAGGLYYYSRTGCPKTGQLGRRSTNEAGAENGGRGGGVGLLWQLFPPSLSDSLAEVKLDVS
jgi:uncharacterized membrane protein